MCNRLLFILCRSNIVIILCLLVNTVIAQNNNLNSENDAIGFPETEENLGSSNKDNRQPVYIPSRCPPNELYYPGDQKDDWICDCMPAHLYHPGSDSCWPAFQRGPCGDKRYLVLPQNSVIPVCDKNPCNVNGYVPWNGKCERLGSITPCNYMYPIAAALGVNATTLVVSCVRLSLESRFGESETVVLPACPPGCKRSVNGKCIPAPM